MKREIRNDYLDLGWRLIQKAALPGHSADLLLELTAFYAVDTKYPPQSRWQVLVTKPVWSGIKLWDLDKLRKAAGPLRDGDFEEAHGEVGPVNPSKYVHVSKHEEGSAAADAYLDLITFWASTSRAEPILTYGLLPQPYSVMLLRPDLTATADVQVADPPLSLPGMEDGGSEEGGYIDDPNILARLLAKLRAEVSS